MWDPIRTSKSVAVCAFRSPRAILASLASSSLVLRGLPDLLGSGTVRLFDALSEYVPLVTVIVARTTPTKVVIVGLLFEWLLFSYLIYRLTPVLLPDDDPAGEITDTRGFKLLVVLLVLPIVQPIAASVGVLAVPSLPTPVDLRFSSKWILIWATGSLVATGSFIYVRWWRDATITERLDVVDQFTPISSLFPEWQAEERADLSRDDWVRPVTDFTLVVASSMVVVVVCFFFGITAGMATIMFPFAELVILFTTAAGTLAHRLPPRLVPGNLTFLVEGTRDIERRFFVTLKYTTRSFKGPHSVPLLLMGFLLSLFFFILSIVGFFIFVWIANVFLDQPSAIVVRSIAFWNAIGVLLCITVPGLYAIWFWVRMASRFPHFLVYWERAKPGSTDVAPPTDLPRMVTRPPGYLLPPMLLWIPVFVALKFGRSLTGLTGVLFGLGWPILLVGVLRSIRWTLRAEPQAPRTDGRALQGAFLVQLSALVGIGQIFPGWFSMNTAVLIAFPLLFLYYIPDIANYIVHVIDVSEGTALLLFGWGIGGVLAVFGLVLFVFGQNTPQVELIGGGGIFLIVFMSVGYALNRLRDAS